MDATPPETLPRPQLSTPAPTAWSRPLVTALYVNAALLALIAMLLIAGNRGGGLLPAAYGQNTPPIAGGAGVFIMPGQLSSTTWGVYLLDVDSQTLGVYSYAPGQRQLQLLAARTYRHDRRLSNFNTSAPTPEEVRELVEREARRLTPPAPPATNPQP
jgi:hypothetical protein